MLDHGQVPLTFADELPVAVHSAPKCLDRFPNVLHPWANITGDEVDNTIGTTVEVSSWLECCLGTAIKGFSLVMDGHVKHLAFPH